MDNVHPALLSMDLARNLLRERRDQWPERAVLEPHEHLWVAAHALVSVGVNATSLFRMISNGRGIKYVVEALDVDGSPLSLAGQEGWDAIVREALAGKGCPGVMSAPRENMDANLQASRETCALMEKCAATDAAFLQALLLHEASPASKNRPRARL